MSELVTELAARWEARCESERHDRRQGSRQREAGAGPKYELVFTDRLLATPVHLRTGLTYEALGVIYQVGKSTIGRTVTEMRPLLAARGFAVPQRPGLRLHTLEDACPTQTHVGRAGVLWGASPGSPSRRSAGSPPRPRRQSSRRICVEHANAEHRQLHPLQRYTGRRDTYGETHAAIAGLVFDRAAERTTQRRTSTELVPVRPMTC